MSAVNKSTAAPRAATNEIAPRPGEAIQETTDDAVQTLADVPAICAPAPAPLLPFDGDNIPATLKARQRWAPWKAVWNEKKQKYGKVPHNYTAPYYGISTAKPEKWGTFEQALKAHTDNPGMFGGLGYVMTGEHDVVGVDLDNCVDLGHPEPSCRIADWALDVVDQLGSYSEVSPSGKGLRIMVLGGIPNDWTNHKVGIEVYGGHQPRFLTLTGRRLRREDLYEVTRPDVTTLEHLAAQYAKSKTTADIVAADMPDILDEMLLPNIADLGIGYRARDFLTEGITGEDRSKTLFATATALYREGLSHDEVFSLLVHNEHAMDVALGHRRQDYDKALMYLWVESCQKGKARAEQSSSPDDFEDLADEGAPAVAHVELTGGAEDFDDVSAEWGKFRFNTPLAPADIAVSATNTVAKYIEKRPAPLPPPYPGPMADAVAAALLASPKPQPELSTLAALIGMAACCDGCYSLPSGARLNLYAAGIAGTGMGKDIPRTVAVAIAALGGAKLIGKPASGQGLEDAIEAGRGMLCEVDEIAHTLAAINSSNTPSYLVELARNLLQLFSASSGVYNTRVRAAAKGTTLHRAVRHPCVNLIGFATPEKLGDAVSASNVQDGLLGRLLFAFGLDGVTPRRPRNRLELPDSTKEAAGRVKTAILAFHAFAVQPGSPDHIAITVEDEAEARLGELLVEFDERACQGSTPFAKALMMRSLEKCERVAGVLAVWDNPTTPVMNAAHVKWAENLLRASDSAALHFCGEYMHGGMVQADAAMLVKTIGRILKGEIAPQRSNERAHLNGGRVTKSFLLRASKLDKRRFEDAVAQLVALAEINVEQTRGRQANGRPLLTCLISLIESDA